MHCHRQDSCQQVEERPQRAESELHLQPGDLVELLHHVEEVQAEQDAREPEGDHGDPAEEHALSVPARDRRLDADEADEAGYLNDNEKKLGKY